MTPPQPKWKSETAEEETGEGQQPRFTMGYWQMRGLGAAIRMLLHWGKYTHRGGAEMNFKDVQYAQDADGVNEWFKLHCANASRYVLLLLKKYCRRGTCN